MKRFIATICIAILAVTLSGCSWIFPKETPDLAPHLIAESEREAEPIRPIDGKETKTVSGADKRAQITDLYKIVADGFRPAFTDDLDPDVERVYESAREVLARYIKNDFDTYARVHAIHDYLAAYIDYDEALYDKYLNKEEITDEHASFHLDGVFLFKSAVCDGFSKAFAFLCGIEEIECVQILGAFGSEPHAWNKVRIKEKWYNVDVTQDKAYYSVGGKQSFQIHHGYFLLSDQSMKLPNYGRHTFADGMNESDEYAHVDYGYYKTQTVEIAGVSYASLVTGKQQLTELFQAVSDSKRAVGKMEIKLEITGVNGDSTSAYADMIAQAYAAVSKPDFMLDADKGYLPYMRYPNGAFVFLIYK